ncbi:MAG: 30S ribosomal protein S3 [Candidatus Woesearchaeota archaeon]|jgi:small subunit ribosomal protein S3
MIERKFISQNMKEFLVKDYLFKQLSRVGLSNVTLHRTPLGEKIVIAASRPGLIVGKGGGNITRLTKELKEKFGLENPQIEIEEVRNPRADAAITAEMIANSLERFGSARFKGVGHKAMGEVMGAGALGVEILISGKIPSSRAKTWRFYQGYLKKCGDVSIAGVDKSNQVARLKSGVVGVQVRIMPSSTVLPDKIIIRDLNDMVATPVVSTESTEKTAEPQAEEKKVEKKAVKRAPAKKKTTKSQESIESKEE